MKLYLVHHATANSLEEDSERHLSELGCIQADRLGARLIASGADPARILHSNKQWVMETAQRIAAIMNISDRTVIAEYDINTGDDLAPFLAEIQATSGDLMMVGHVEFLRRAAAKLVTGNDAAQVISFKPNFGTAFCLEEEDDGWIVRSGWRQDDPAG